MSESSMFALYLADAPLTAVCSEQRLVEHMLTFEAALATVQGRLGVIPAEAAAAIAAILPGLRIAPAALAEGTRQHGIPTLPLLALARQALPETARDYLHWGATSQDVLDTAQVLLAREALTQLTTQLNQLLAALPDLLTRYGHLPLIGRTRTQQAVPIPFGLRIASWANPLLRHRQRLSQLKPRLLVSQLGGAAGSLSALGDQGTAVAQALAEELGLGFALPWHTQRDNFAELTNWLALLTGTLGKLGQDVLTMAQTEIGEVVEQAGGGGKSSTMPHKSNPVLSEALVVLARQNAQFAALQLQSLLHANERDGTAWPLEWENLPRMLVGTGAALRHALTICQHLTPDAAAMQRNLAQLNGLPYAEAATFRLARQLPRAEAQALVAAASAAVVAEGKPLAVALQALTPSLGIDWEAELQPTRQLGMAQHIIDQTLRALQLPAEANL